MFMIKTEDVIQVLEDVKRMRDLVREFQDMPGDSSIARVQVAEYYREWVSTPVCARGGCAGSCLRV